MFVTPNGAAHGVVHGSNSTVLYDLALLFSIERLSMPPVFCVPSGISPKNAFSLALPSHHLFCCVHSYRTAGPPRLQWLIDDDCLCFTPPNGVAHSVSFSLYRSKQPGYVSLSVRFLCAVVLQWSSRTANANALSQQIALTPTRTPMFSLSMRLITSYTHPCSSGGLPT